MQKSLRMFCVIACVIMLGAGVVTAAQNDTAAPAADLNTPDYYSLVEKLKNNETNIDFMALRLSYTKTKDYMPYGDDKAKVAAFDALNKKIYAEALKQAEIVLAKNYVDMDMHFLCMVAYRELGNSGTSAFHRSVFRGLVNSLSESGDGTTHERAIVVISVREEYVFLSAGGLKLIENTKVTANGHHYDKMDVKNKDAADKKVIYFNIDIPFHWLTERLAKHFEDIKDK